MGFTGRLAGKKRLQSRKRRNVRLTQKKPECFANAMLPFRDRDDKKYVVMRYATGTLR
jgi:hypothetical protein